KESSYDRLLDFFHSPSLDIDRLTALWCRTVLRIFSNVLTVNGRILVVGDGLKIPKEGKKMPGVKLLHQESE
ncbi:MAG TPA: IS4 family transposase, partial [Nitrospiraceae bacterium]|nr:IS4 family transposase [Nitrospiraceae bacterium]